MFQIEWVVVIVWIVCECVYCGCVVVVVQCVFVEQVECFVGCVYQWFDELFCECGFVGVGVIVEEYQMCYEYWFFDCWFDVLLCLLLCENIFVFSYIVLMMLKLSVMLMLSIYEKYYIGLFF